MRGEGEEGGAALQSVGIVICHQVITLHTHTRTHTHTHTHSLSDSSSAVRKNTLVVLARLILNDMVKVKGQISELALCLEDPEKHISDLTRLFFFELSKKVPTISCSCCLFVDVFICLLTCLPGVDMPVMDSPFSSSQSVWSSVQPSGHFLDPLVYHIS